MTAPVMAAVPIRPQQCIAGGQAGLYPIRNCFAGTGLRTVHQCDESWIVFGCHLCMFMGTVNG